MCVVKNGGVLIAAVVIPIQIVQAQGRSVPQLNLQVSQLLSALGLHGVDNRYWGMIAQDTLRYALEAQESQA